MSSQKIPLIERKLLAESLLDDQNSVSKDFRLGNRYIEGVYIEELTVQGDKILISWSTNSFSWGTPKSPFMDDQKRLSGRNRPLRKTKRRKILLNEEEFPLIAYQNILL